jgi:hypothetical protein
MRIQDLIPGPSPERRRDFGFCDGIAVRCTIIIKGKKKI